MLTHYAWDYGAIDDAFDEVLGFHVSHKSTKTICGKRVNPKYIDNSAPTCPKCQEEKRLVDESRKSLEGMLR